MNTPLKVDQQANQAYLQSRHLQTEPVAPRRYQPEIGGENRGVQTSRATPSPSKVRAATPVNVLSPIEQSTLEALFGPRERTTPQFYGNAKIATISKGSFLDIKG